MLVTVDGKKKKVTTLTDTATVKAIAIKNGVSSEAATKVFTKNGSNVGSGGFETGN